MTGPVELEFQTAAEPLVVLAARNRVPSRSNAKSCQPPPATNLSRGPITIPSVSVRRSGQRSSPSCAETNPADVSRLPGRAEPFSLGVESDGVIFRRKHQFGLSIGDIPEAHGVIIADRRQPVTEGMERQRFHERSMTLEPLNERAGVRAPNEHR